MLNSSVIYKKIVRPLLFKFDAERAHSLLLSSSRLVELPGVHRTLASLLGPESKHSMPVTFLGKQLPHPIGLASGADKDCEAVPLFSSLGFSSIELGGVTPLPEKGNPKPRLHRLVAERAIINRMGFPSCGVKEMSRRLRALPARFRPPLLGMNLGRNMNVPLENAADDFGMMIGELADLVDFISVNISCPNSGAHRDLQNRNHLENILSKTKEANSRNIPIALPLEIYALSSACWRAIREALLQKEGRTNSKYATPKNTALEERQERFCLIFLS
jgi:dihydroorotate dehydrogenase